MSSENPNRHSYSIVTNEIVPNLENGDATSGSSPTDGNNSANGNGSLEAVGDGNEVFFSAELLPAKVLVQLPSKAAADSKALPLFVVHPIEGFVDALAPLASRLATPVWGLQCTAEAPLESLQQLAVYYVQHVRTIQAHGPYTIAGYSYGAAVAFEMVIELERLGEKAQLVLLDGSPKYVAWFTREQRSRASSNGTDNVSASEAEALGLAYFGFVCAELNFSQTTKALVQLKTFDDRLEAIAQLISKISPKHSKDLVRLLEKDSNIDSDFTSYFCFVFRLKKQLKCFTRNWWQETATSRMRRPNRTLCCSRPPTHRPNCRKTMDSLRYVCLYSEE